MNRIVIVALLTLIIGSCKPPTQKSSALLPTVLGNANEVLVVMSDRHWNDTAGGAVRNTFGELFRGLPQMESAFDIMHVQHENFSGAFKHQRSILVVKIGPDHKKSMVIKKEVWARTQLVIALRAKTPEEFLDLLNEKQKEIKAIFADAELKRLMDDYKIHRNGELVNKIKDKHDLTIYAPKGFEIVLNEENFVWLTNEYRDITEGILLYHYPYKDDDAFTKEKLLEKRDYFTKKFVPGEIEGSYMTTEKRFPIDMTVYNMYDSIYTTELRGLWHIKGGMAMGGPFVSISQYDKKRGRIVCAEGFIYAPAHDKRELVRHIEAIVYSMSY